MMVFLGKYSGVNESLIILVNESEQDLQKIGHLETRSADDLREEFEYLQYLENEYPEGILEQAP